MKVLPQQRFFLLFLFAFSTLPLALCSESLEAAKPAAEQKRKEYDLARRAHLMFVRWLEEESVSGLQEVWWDNCDGGHSRVNLEQLPGMRKYEDSKWGLQTRVRDTTTVGNSSTAHKQIEKGSQTRSAYSAIYGLSALRKQYRKNNIYIYPSHMDYIAGNQRLGKSQTKKQGSGRGDMFPTNTPFAITSLGSSGSDQPFIRAVAWTIGSFRSNVREKLEADGMLMPTVQMLLRRTQKHVQSDDDYFSGIAHPSVFDRTKLDPIAMMEAAREMRMKDIPPLVQMTVIEEEAMQPGKDYLGPPALKEQLFDSPEVISRIWRGYPFTRRMVISAQETLNPSGLPLQFKWVVLRGDPAAIDIRPFGENDASAEITFSYPFRHDRTGVEGIWSNRFDVGVFAITPRSVSVPGFVTWMGLDHEERRYDRSNNLASIDYGTGRFVDPRIGVAHPFREEHKWVQGEIASTQRVESQGSSDDVDSPVSREITAPKPRPKRSAVPRATELEEARKRLSAVFATEVTSRLRRVAERGDAEFYVLHESVCHDAASTGDAITLQASLKELENRFDSTLIDLKSQVLTALCDNPDLEEAQALVGAQLAIDANQAAAKAGKQLLAASLAKQGLSMARISDDVEQQREATRAIMEDKPSH